MSFNDEKMAKDNLCLIDEDDIRKKKTRCRSSFIFIAFIVVLALVVAIAFVSLLLFALQSAGSTRRTRPIEECDGDLQEIQNWNSYKEKFGKYYETDVTDVAHMREYLKAREIICKHNEAFNRGEKSYTLRLNQLSDLLPEERYNMFGCRIGDDYGEWEMNITETSDLFDSSLDGPISIPDHIDWRKKGYVTHVKNQGQCGSCYAFAAIGALEGQMKHKSGNLIPLSEQDIVDCSNGYAQNRGCHGGSIRSTFDFIKEKGGIQSEKSYPYSGKGGEKCKFEKQKSVASDKGYVLIQAEDEVKLKTAVAVKGPIAVTINGHAIQHYRKGVFDDESCKTPYAKLNHAVLVVGYGKDVSTKKDYWIIKNSWATTWGEDGYMKLVRNKNCLGVAYRPSYPLV